MEMNHLVTDSILAISGLSTLGSSVHLVLKLASLMKDGSRNKSGCSAQYCENSDKETGDRINGGATKEDRSPLKVETDFKKEVHAEELAYPDIILEALEIGLFYLFIIIMFSGGKALSNQFAEFPRNLLWLFGIDASRLLLLFVETFLLSKGIAKLFQKERFFLL